MVLSVNDFENNRQSEIAA